MAANVFVIGGLGFIGHHLVRELLDNGYKVSVGSRSANAKAAFDIPVIYIDLKSISDEELKDMLSAFDYVVFAGGADDRHILSEKPYPFFYNENVVPCIRLAKASKETKVRKILILGSYFAHFNRLYPEWKMTERHPYVKSRILQLTETKNATEGKTEVTTLEIPYVFGSAPGRTPLWMPLINYIDKMPLVFYTKGGTNIIAVEELAKAITGVITYPENRDHWIVGGENVTWKEMIQMIGRALGKNKIVITLPNFIVRLSTLLLKLYFSLTGKYAGLDPYHFVTTQTSLTHLDLSESMEKLEYGPTDLQKSIRSML